MFKKKPNIKALAPLRSSDRRKIADQIIKEYRVEIPPAEIPEGPENESSSSAPNLGSIRNSLLPENALSARFTTTVGPDLQQTSGTLYVGAHPDGEQRVLWFKVEERLLPTVYTLWKHPHLVPLLHVQDFVLQKLRGGAPLMTPGLARGPPFPANATKNAVVAVASLEKPTVPMVVGVCDIDVSTLQHVQGVRGHAVRGEHWASDEIWAWGQGGVSGQCAPESIETWAEKDTAASLERGMEQASIDDIEDDGDGGVLLEQGVPSQPHSHANEHVNGEGVAPYEEVSVEDKEFTTKEIDEIFRNAFLYAVHQLIHTNKHDPRHGLSFPIPQSLVISNLVLPYLPITTPSEAAYLQIKKTSWKTPKKFIKSLEKEKILKSKDRDGGECVVLDIDFEDRAFASFVPYKLPKKDTLGADSCGGKAVAAGSSSKDNSIGQQLKKITLYRPKDRLAPLFTAANASHKELYLPTELRPIINAYIDAENLVSETNKRLVKLNPIFANAVFDGHSSLDREVLAKGTVPRDVLMERILEACSVFWVMLRNDETRESVKAKAGHGPKIQIVLETRSGNKTVSKVSGVEPFYINPQPLADELQKACASSTSVNQLVGSSPKTPVMEIMVQGPQKDVVIKALGKRGVNRQWIEVVDKTKGKKTKT